MNTYMLLIHDDMKRYSQYSREELGGLIGKMGEWSQELRKMGVHKGAEKLEDDSPIFVSGTSNGETHIDGPFTESKELIGGFFLVEAENQKAAAEIARGCPALAFASRIEVRQVTDTCQNVVDRGN